MRAADLHPRFRIAAAAVVLVAGHTADAAVYRCTLPDAPPRFSQFPCPNGEVIELEPLRTMTIPGLTEAEQRLLDELAQQREAQRNERQRAREQAEQDARLRRDERRERCQAARLAQAELAQKRRKGYTVAEARVLDRQGAEIDAEIRHNC